MDQQFYNQISTSYTEAAAPFRNWRITRPSRRRFRLTGLRLSHHLRTGC